VGRVSDVSPIRLLAPFCIAETESFPQMTFDGGSSYSLEFSTFPRAYRTNIVQRWKTRCQDIDGSAKHMSPVDMAIIWSGEFSRFSEHFWPKWNCEILGGGGFVALRLHRAMTHISCTTLDGPHAHSLTPSGRKAHRRSYIVFNLLNKTQVINNTHYTQILSTKNLSNSYSHMPPKSALKKAQIKTSQNQGGGKIFDDLIAGQKGDAEITLTADKLQELQDTLDDLKRGRKRGGRGRGRGGRGGGWRGGSQGTRKSSNAGSTLQSNQTIASRAGRSEATADSVAQTVIAATLRNTTGKHCALLAVIAALRDIKPLLPNDSLPEPWIRALSAVGREDTIFDALVQYHAANGGEENTDPETVLRCLMARHDPLRSYFMQTVYMHTTVHVGAPGTNVGPSFASSRAEQSIIGPSIFSEAVGLAKSLEDCNCDLSRYLSSLLNGTVGPSDFGFRL